MIKRPRAHELLLGISIDRVFGPVLLIGHGGTAAEVIGDRAIGLPPLNQVLAREMIDRTRVARLLGGYRDRPPADIEAVAAALVSLSRLAADFRDIAELDINPLLVDETGVLALDARIIVRQAPVSDDFAIRAYPADIEHEVGLRSGATVLIRAIRPDDEPKIVDMVARSSEEDVRLRFLGPLKRLPHEMASRLSQIDYDREIALVAEAPEGGDICGVARLIADPDNEAAEFAVMVRSDMKGKGLGYELMSELLAHARRHGLKTLFGDILQENTMMLQMAGELGFTRIATDDPRIVRVSNDLLAGRAG
jgi:acetyltransferase